MTGSIFPPELCILRASRPEVVLAWRGGLRCPPVCIMTIVYYAMEQQGRRKIHLLPISRIVSVLWSFVIQGYAYVAFACLEQYLVPDSVVCL